MQRCIAIKRLMPYLTNAGRVFCADTLLHRQHSKHVVAQLAFHESKFGTTKQGIFLVSVESQRAHRLRCLAGRLPCATRPGTEEGQSQHGRQLCCKADTPHCGFVVTRDLQQHPYHKGHQECGAKSRNYVLVTTTCKGPLSERTCG